MKEEIRNQIKQYPEIDREYIHYKGGRYKVISMAKHTETDEVLVMYKSIHFGSVYARPLFEWFDSITISNENEPLETVSRFSLVKI